MESCKAAESSHHAAELAVAAEAEKGFSAEGRYPVFRLAETSAILGRKRDALDYLCASYHKHELYMVTLPVDSAFSSLRAAPVYRNLIGQLGLDVPN
jgi:hypothetical protein